MKLFFHRTTFSIIALSVIFNFNAFIASAETLNFEQIRQKVLKNNPGISAKKIAIKAAEAEIKQAEVIPNPELEIGTENFGENEVEVVLSQSIEIGGRREARIKIAQKALRGSEIENEFARLELEAEIIRRCVPILGLQKKITVLDSLSLNLNKSLDDIKRRSKAGAVMEADTLRTEMEIDELLMERGTLNRQLDQYKNELSALWGSTDEGEIQLECALNPTILIPPKKDIHKKIPEHPEMKLLKLNEEITISEIGLLKAEAFPELSVSGGYLRNNEDNENAVLASVSISLPFFDRNKGAILSKNHELAASGKEFQALYIESIKEAGSILSEIENTNEIFSILTNKLQPKAKSVHSLLDRYYKLGNISILEVLESRRNLLEINLRYIDLLIEKALLAADLMEISGIPIQIIY